MTNGANGQLVRFYGDGFTTIQNNATQVTVAGSDLPLAANRIYQFIRQNWLFAPNLGRRAGPGRHAEAG
jgi:hypothetical protein